MKKIVVFVFLLISISIYSDGYDFSVGAGYGFGYYINSKIENVGLYQKVLIPISFTYYPEYNDSFSIGFKNKIGYRIILFCNIDSTFQEKNTYASDKNPRYIKTIRYDNPITEHEFYDNLSLLLKIGKNNNNVKAFIGIGCSTRFSLLYAPIYDVNWEFYNDENRYIDTNTNITPGVYNYFSIGPSLEVGIELINIPKTLSVSIGVPFELQFPVNSINFTENYVEKPAYSSLVSSKEKQYSSNFWINHSLGLEFIISFYTFKKKF